MDKRKINNSLVSFKPEFTDEQKEARQVMHDNIVTVLTGKPGTAKTFLCASVALELLMHKGYECPHKHQIYYKDVREIIITRPSVEAGETMGFEPGSSTDPKEGKMAEFASPVLDNMVDLVGEQVVEELINKGAIKVKPLQKMRGKTFKNAVVILDEGQNATLDQFILLSTRLGYNAKLLITSDWRQVDLAQRNKSANDWFNYIMELDGVANFELTKNYRHPLALAIMDKLLEEKTK